ncbi:outer membrane protein OmpA-like peptidoglycan-associated protein [Nocardiopsis mwathae]|uniref:Outer membrane protein OmpA-like peptidoglycan-associated protein n=1 Tax=Nocardiopsis mwathae TaxID=1472723 RepID=A0A7W9YDP6_9ACTN|nr:OmpA family protein [Nocardiopsis mwathae]MBB6170232.1 outer membrane protein OmpA-like peptidoglycan-associated protein [Nocardiopsis mwathae]
MPPLIRPGSGDRAAADPRLGRRIRTMALLAPVILATSSCGLFNDAQQADSADTEDDRSADVVRPEAFTREVMLSNKRGDNASATLRLDAVETTDESTAVHLTLTNQGETMSGPSVDSTMPTLMDPVDGAAYPPLSDQPFGHRNPKYYGSHSDGARVPFFEGADNAFRFYFPPLPENTDHVTFFGFGAGAMTGVPVERVDEHRPIPAPGVDGESREPEPGETLDWPVRQPDGDEHATVLDTEGYVEGADATLIREGEQETIALAADVLFAFDESELTTEAADLLADAAASIEANATGDGGTIVVTGHSDGVGDDDYNRTLSEARAQAVQEALEALLDTGYDYDVSGKGSTEPLAAEGGADDEEARKRNRRVELSYHAVSGNSGGGSDGAQEGSGIAAAERHVSAPASYRTDPGDPVADQRHDDFKLAVYPLLRDGAHLVAEFELTNTGELGAEPDLGDDRSLRRYSTSRGESLSGFRITQSTPELTRYPLLFQYEGEYAPVAERVGKMEPGETFRLAMLFPAPSPETDEVTLDAGPFGEVSVPIT